MIRIRRDPVRCIKLAYLLDVFLDIFIFTCHITLPKVVRLQFAKSDVSQFKDSCCK